MTVMQADRDWGLGDRGKRAVGEHLEPRRKPHRSSQGDPEAGFDGRPETMEARADERDPRGDSSAIQNGERGLAEEAR